MRPKLMSELNGWIWVSRVSFEEDASLACTPLQTHLPKSTPNYARVSLQLINKHNAPPCTRALKHVRVSQGSEDPRLREWVDRGEGLSHPVAPTIPCTIPGNYHRWALSFGIRSEQPNSCSSPVVPPVPRSGGIGSVVLGVQPDVYT